MGNVKKIWNWLIGAPGEPENVPNMMLLVDARSGRSWRVPDNALTRFAAGQELRVDFPEGEYLQVLAVEPGLRRARALVRHASLDPTKRTVVTTEAWVPLQVRWFHPAFMRQHVAFIPS